MEDVERIIERDYLMVFIAQELEAPKAFKPQV